MECTVRMRRHIIELSWSLFLGINQASDGTLALCRRSMNAALLKALRWWQGASRMADLLRPTGTEIIRQLEAGKLPQMVDWFDPFVLGTVAVRTLISSTIGEYADQRPMQEAADAQRDMGVLTRRHD